MTAVCIRCGAAKDGPFLACLACATLPRGSERETSYLLSEACLDTAAMARASRRIRWGLHPRLPVDRLLEAQEAAAASPPIPFDDPPQPWDEEGPAHGRLRPWPLSLVFLLALLSGGLSGIVLWWGWRRRAPLAARQVFHATWPAVLLLGVLWVAMLAWKGS